MIVFFVVSFDLKQMQYYHRVIATETEWKLLRFAITDKNCWPEVLLLSEKSNHTYIHTLVERGNAYTFRLLKWKMDGVM